MASTTWNILILLLIVTRVMVSRGDDDDDDVIDLSEYAENLFGKPNFEVGEILSKWNTTETEKMNPEEEGDYLQGDILVPTSSNLRNGVLAEFSHWPKGVIPFEISGGFSKYFYCENFLHNFFALTKMCFHI